MKNRVSIVVPVYNTYKYLEKCLTSLVKQTYTDIEIIVVDDGSPDNSFLVYKEFAKKDNRVRFLRKENRGVSEARNTGIEMSTGEYIIFVDSDDWMEINGIQVLMEEYEKTGADLVVADVYGTDENGEKKRYCKVFNKDNFIENNPSFIEQYQRACLGYGYNPYPVGSKNVSGIGSTWNKLFKLELIKKNNLRFDPYVCGIYDDNLFVLHYLSVCRSVAYISRPIYNYVSLSNSITHRYKENTLEISHKIFERIEDFIKLQSKPNIFYKPYYMYIIRRLSRELDVYYFAKDNQKTWKQIKVELRENISKKPYKQAIYNVENKKLMPAHWFVWFSARINNPNLIRIMYWVRTFVKKSELMVVNA